MENKQTAVEFLLSKMWLISGLEWDDAIIQAKAMEKEQTKDAYEYGYWRGNNDDDFEPEEYCENPYGKDINQD